jgi:hypothetical protein
MRRHDVAKDRTMNLVRQQEIDHLRLLGRLGNRDRLEPIFNRRLEPSTVALANHEIHAAIAQIQGMRSTLRSVTQNGDPLSGQGRWVNF